MGDETPKEKLVRMRTDAALEVAEELPVVARLVVEIRSDGTRTTARGAMEDAASGMRASIEASGQSPLELALGLAKSILAAPWFTRQITRSGIRALLRKP